MANGKKGPKMDQKTVKRLLDGLTKDDAFRAKFESDAAGALESIGYTPVEGEALAGQCLQLQSGESLATAESIEADRAKLESSLVAVFHFDCPAALKATR
ncbi:NHLP-related RiPP peptide [Lysobacter sp. A6]|uniref:NHLP-related RiPP peptide n=1 Tax=Noviluteimonas lactosilytica TaxID=2888523 RepID=A0ABS8JHY5_9GAMM|nr:NHLP-related RiPP peptide [Lysobacter lactosilyticus]MCC8363215.1 NHLP-related RiPP peptide [Lysobacter lactosilyticus]